MKALTLTQPWASFVAHGAKRIETRSWRTNYRGLLAIHAAKGFPAECRDLCWTSPFFEALHGHGYFPPAPAEGEPPTVLLPRGGIVAVVTLEDVVKTETIEPLFKTGRFLPHERAFGDYTPGRFGWLFSPTVLRLAVPVPCRGALGLWDISPGLERLIRETRVA